MGPSIKHHSEVLSQKYQPSSTGMSSSDHYKIRLKDYMDRQVERMGSKYGVEQSSSNMQYSRVFREKQSRRMFD